jgi:ATPases with chaperone activity, ATP-binding subunit
MEDAKMILLGLKEKYEMHHGVKIDERGLAACVELASRYIPDRFLPDKAVDLMDEAMSSLRLDIESEPAEVEKLRKELQHLQVEYEAIKKTVARKSSPPQSH